MECIVLNWWYDESVYQAHIVTNEDGANMVFEDFTSAEEWAEKELNGHWKVVVNNLWRKQE